MRIRTIVGIIAFFLVAHGLYAQVKVYRKLPVFEESSTYRVEIAQGKKPFQEIYVYQMDTEVGKKAATRTENWGSFAFEPASGAVQIRISMKDGSALSADNAQLVNKTYTDVSTSFSGNSLIINVGSAKKHLLVKVAGQTGNPLMVFADPLQESAIPKEANVFRFKAQPTPYIMEAEYDRYTIPNDVDVVYIEDGAVIQGTIHVDKTRTKPVKVMGRGVVLGKGPIINGKGGIPYNAVVLRQNPGNIAEGITVIKSRHFGVDMGDHSLVDNVKMFGYNYNNDGIVAGIHSKVLHTFFKVNDDHMKLYNDDIFVQYCTFYAQTNGAIFQFSWGGSGPAHNCTIQDCEVIAVEFTQCGDPALGQGGIARAFINLHDHNDANSNFSGHTFRNIRIQGQLIRFISINGKYVGSKSLSFSNTLLDNITIDHTPTLPNLLYTGDNESLNFTMRNVTADGKCFTLSDFKTEGEAKVDIQCQTK